jgi:hypothetical protein
LISAKLDKKDEERSSFMFQNVPQLFHTPWIWGEMRKCEEEAEKSLQCVYRKRKVLNAEFWFTNAGELRVPSIQLFPPEPVHVNSVQTEFLDPLARGPIQTAHFPLFFSVFSDWVGPWFFCPPLVKTGTYKIITLYH